MSSALEAVATQLARVDLSTQTARGSWGMGETLVHCAQSLEYAVRGFPRMKPWWFRASVGKIALWKFLRQGYMRHDLQAEIPGAPALGPCDLDSARRRLNDAIGAFSAAATLAPHFAYGQADKARMDRVQALHILDHLPFLASKKAG